MAINPFQEIYEACNTGTNKEKIKNPIPFPRYLDIELTNLCNYKCKMCPTGMDMVNRHKGFMAGNVFHKILDEIQEYKTPIRFVRWGEPMIHGEFLTFIREAEENGIRCHFNTNGFFMDCHAIKEILDIPLTSIKFSFQGVDAESYKRMRGMDFYHQLLSICNELYTKRIDYPCIQIGTTVTDESQEDIFKFEMVARQIADKVTVGKTRDLLGGSDVGEHYKCPEVFDKLSINWDGTVTACCSDWDNMMLIGDVKSHTLKEIWEGHKLQYYRKKIANREYEKLKLCSICVR